MTAPAVHAVESSDPLPRAELVVGTTPGRLPVALAAVLARDWPSVQLSHGTGSLDDAAARRGRAVARIDADEWLAEDVDLLALDRRVHRAEDASARGPVIALSGPPAALARVVPELLLRHQRFFPRTNGASDSRFFRSVLGLHRALHDGSKPLVRADWEHAIDTWQWVLRLEPEAPLAVQLAALFHDVERLVGEPERRVEQHAEDYLAFKSDHAREGAALVRRILHVVEAWPELVEAVSELVLSHEHGAARRADVELLTEADALSFFSLNAAGFVRYFDAAHVEKKVEYTLARMGPRARAELPRIRHEPRVRALLEPSGALGPRRSA
ncbi:DUF4202 domain-containing protein [Myxococcota bacterium]|nr:DUF4202 domain-containing protein [Myxococcota bacterium]